MKRLMSILIIFVFVIGVFNGCSSNNEKKEDVSQETTKKNEATNDTKDEIEISMITAMAYGTEGLDIAVEGFKKLHPKVTFDIQHIPNDHITVIKSRVNSGQTPDILVAQTGSSVANYYDYAYDFTNDPILDKFKSNAIEMSKSKDGRVLSLPWTYETMGIIYNKDVFEKAGIKELPTTLDELEVVCEKIKEKGILPFATGLKEQWVLAHIASHFMANDNTDPNITVEAISNGELKFKDMKNFNNLYRLIDMMVKYGPQKPLEVNWEKSENLLSNGEAAMIHMGDWCEATLKEFNPNVNVGFMPVPVSNDSKDSNLLSSISWQFLVNKESPNAEMAREFLDYILTSEQGLTWMTQYVGAVPGSKTDIVPSGMLASSAQKLINNGETKAWNHILWPSGYITELGSYLQEYLIGTYDKETTTNNINEGWLNTVE